MSRNQLDRHNSRKLEDWLLKERDAILDGDFPTHGAVAAEAQKVLGFTITEHNVKGSLDVVGLVLHGREPIEPPSLATLASLVADLYAQSSLTIPTELKPFVRR